MIIDIRDREVNHDSKQGLFVLKSMVSGPNVPETSPVD